MEKANIINLLKNSGINVIGMDKNFIYFEDPNCLLPAFDTIFHWAWIIALTLLIFILFGWGVLYIKNGVKISTFFNNIKTLFLVLMVFSLTKPIVNMIYGDRLFGSQCETKQVSMSAVKELLDQRNKTFSKSDEAILNEHFEVIDSGVQ